MVDVIPLVALRNATVTALLGVTDAGMQVEAERIDPVQPGDVPRIAVFGDAEMNNEAQAGSLPRFHVTGNLVVQCLVQGFDRNEAVGRLDHLVYQVMSALLTSSAWLAYSEAIASIRIVHSYKGETGAINGDGRIAIACSWRETWFADGIGTALSALTLTTEVASGTPAISGGSAFPIADPPRPWRGFKS